MAAQPPVLPDPNTQRTRSTWATGETAKFQFKIVDSQGAAIEMLDTTKYPSYAIIAPSGIQVQTGVLSVGTNAGEWFATWSIPVQSELSNDQRAYQIRINIVTKRRSQRELIQDFNVVQKTVTSSGDRDIIKSELEGKDYRAVWRGDFDPEELYLEAYLTHTPYDDMKKPLPTVIDKSLMNKVIDGDSICYYYDIPASGFVPGTQSIFNNQFTVLWGVRETVVSDLQTEYQQLRILKRAGFEQISGLRFIVDRFQHRFGTAYHMSDSDLIESLSKGLGALNQWFPYSTYTDQNIPPALQTFWTMMSAWWMLRSQHLLSGSLAFNFSGSSVSLDQDMTGAIDSAIQGMSDWLNTQLTPAKTMVFRQASQAGVVAVRPSRLSSMYNRVYKVDSTGPNGGMGPPGLMSVAQIIGLTP